MHQRRLGGSSHSWSIKRPTYDRVRMFGNLVSKRQPAAECGKASLQMELVDSVRRCNVARSFSVMRPEYSCEELGSSKIGQETNIRASSNFIED